MDSVPLEEENPLVAYCRLLNLGEPPVLREGESNPKSFQAARTEIHKAHAVPMPETLEYDECRLEWPAGKVEGSVRHGAQISRFGPSERGAKLPPPGTEVRIRHAEGSARAIVLRSSIDGVFLVRAPNRKERRAHPRVELKGIATLWIPNSHESEPSLAVQDVSEGGVGASAPFPMEVGQSLHFLLRLEGRSVPPLECEGVVTSCREVYQDELGKHRVGIKFTSLPESLIEEIRRAVLESRKNQ